MIKCPECNDELLFLEKEDNESFSIAIEIRYYKCENCNKSYKRIIFRNKIGLIFDDTLHEKGNNGYYVRVY